MLIMLIGMGFLFILGFSVCCSGAILIIEEQVEQQMLKWISLSIIAVLGVLMLFGLLVVLFLLIYLF